MSAISKTILRSKMIWLVNTIIHTEGQLKWNLLIDVKTSTYIDFDVQYGQKKFLLSRKSKVLCCGHMLFVILTVRKLSEHFMSTENGQVIIIALTVGLIRKI